MLINFQQSLQKYNMHVRGVIHVGAHYGQEYKEYRSAGIQNVVFIEPCSKAFQVLQDTLGMVHGIKLINSACGAEFSIATMNVEQANQGMSNSLLKPAKHLEQYPSIQFTDTEEVEVHPLDELAGMDRERTIPPAKIYNLLVMDVQGYELEVLKGATGTLNHIDYIYTEVNRDEVYEGCAKVHQLDEFLTDFQRVETNWAGGTWGDAWYIRKSLLK